MAGLKSDKRSQVDKDKTKIFVVISVSAAITIASLVIAKGYWSQGNYLNKVIDRQEKALKVLQTNQAEADSLEESYKSFTSQSPNLLSGSLEGKTDRDGDNATLVLDALPSKYDFPAMASSLEKMLSGYNIASISGIDDSANQMGVTGGGPVEMPFSFGVRTNYDGWKKLSSNFNLSIRPFYFSTVELRGTNDSLTINVTGKTFYQPEQGIQITEMGVK